LTHDNPFFHAQGGFCGIALGGYEENSNQMLVLRCAKYNGTFHQVFARSQRQKSEA
jgi:hypothetical protein